MSVSRRIELSLPPNGQQLVEKVLAVFKQDLENHFKIALAYPNANFKLQWSSTFYSQPMYHEGLVDILIRAENETVTSLEDKGIQQSMEMGSLEIGVPSGGSPALTRPGLPSSNLPPPATESKGRRDVNARNGRGIDFAGGAPVTDNLANLDGRSIGGEVAKALSDLPKDTKPFIAKEDPLIISQDGIDQAAGRVIPAMDKSKLIADE